MRPQVGQVINNKYRLLRLIGDGGMGSVYEARHEVLGTSVALKFLHAELAKRPGLVQRFLQEARVSAQITSPHVVRVTDVDQTPGGAFMVMEYIEGKTLQTLYEDLYKAGLQLSYPDALEYALQMLEGVEAAHKSGVVHRDLKPDNVMITMDAKGRALLKLLDFGIAKLKVAEDYDRKLTRPGVIMGTPEYMAPEQAYSADAVDARADIFSLGVMVFEMLAARRPVGGEDAHQIAAAYLSGAVARLNDLAPDVAPALADAVHRAMAPLPGDRWASVTAFRDAIEPFGAAARAPSALPPSPSLVMAAIPSPVMKSSPGFQRPPPATNPGLLSGQGPVPKTLPPEADTDADGFVPPLDSPGDALRATGAMAVAAPAPVPQASAARAAPRDATLLADPPSMSSAPSRDPTPLGGFGSFGVDGAEGRASTPSGSNGTTAAVMFPATRSAVPYFDGVSGADAREGGGPQAPAGRDPGSTALATPLDGGFGGGVAPPGGVHAGMPPPVYVPPHAAAPPANARKRPGPLSSLPAILALAAAVSAVVVGGVYVAQRTAKTDDHDDSPPPPPAATVVSDPPPPDEPPSTATPATPPPPQRPWKPATPLKQPPPRGSAGPVAPPPGSAPKPPREVPIIPSVWVLPSTLPFNLPFGPRADPPRGQPPDGPPPPRSPRGARQMSHDLVHRPPAWRPRPPPPPPPPPWEPFYYAY